MKPLALVLSCEHATNYIPDEFLHYFKNNKEILHSHKAYDIGTQFISRHIQTQLACPYTEATVSRLLIDCNRSVRKKQYFSKYSINMPETEKKYLEEHYYLPYRIATIKHIEEYIKANNQVLHISVHSFTPFLNGIQRNAAFGILYDHRRHGECEVAREWRRFLIHKGPLYRVRMNYPYLGTSDGFTTSLRKRWTEKEYLGIELEVNQILCQEESQNHPDLIEVSQIITDSIRQLLELFNA